MCWRGNICDFGRRRWEVGIRLALPSPLAITQSSSGKVEEHNVRTLLHAL